MMMFLPSAAGVNVIGWDKDGFPLPLGVTLAAAKDADVTASPERKSLRFMKPRFQQERNAEGYHWNVAVSYWAVALRPAAQPASQPNLTADYADARGF